MVKNYLSSLLPTRSHSYFLPFLLKNSSNDCINTAVTVVSWSSAYCFIFLTSGFGKRHDVFTALLALLLLSLSSLIFSLSNTVVWQWSK